MARAIPLIVVASASGSTADDMAARLRREGAVVIPTHSAEGCLRVATSVGPDLVVIDPALPTRRLERLLHAHPTSAGARLMSLDEVLFSEAPRSAPAVRVAA